MDEDTLGAYTARGVLLLEIDMQLNSRYVPSKLQFSPVVNSSLVKLKPTLSKKSSSTSSCHFLQPSTFLPGQQLYSSTVCTSISKLTKIYALRGLLLSSLMVIFILKLANSFKQATFYRHTPWHNLYLFYPFLSSQYHSICPLTLSPNSHFCLTPIPSAIYHPH